MCEKCVNCEHTLCFWDGFCLQGNDAMDMFIDPLSVFGSERHPALQEVLKQIDKTKKSRGEYLRKMRELQGD